MSRPVRNLIIEDLGQLEAISYRTNEQGKIIWKVRCQAGTIHEMSADSLTRKRYPIRSCGVCGRDGYMDQAIYHATQLQLFGWLQPFGRMRSGDVREIRDTRKRHRRKGKGQTRTYWGCRCLGRSLGHTDCLGWVHRSTRGLRRMRDGCCTMCKPHYRLYRAELFERIVENEEKPTASVQRRLTKVCYYAMVHRVKRVPKYQKLGMYEGWKGEGGFERMVEEIRMRPHIGVSIHRINDDIGYFPRNVKWASDTEQANVRSTSNLLEIDGQTVNLSTFARSLGKDPSAVSRQLKRLQASGFSKAQAIGHIRAMAHTVQHNVAITERPTP